jgi:integrase
MKLFELFDLYARKRLRVASPNTHRLYRHSIAAFEVTLKREATTLDLVDDNLDEHMARLIRDGLAVASANKDYAQITAIWRFANRNRLVDTWPNVLPYPEPERVPLGWLPSELDRLFEAIGSEQGTIHGSPASLWWKTLILVLLDCGERIGAIRKLKREDAQEIVLYFSSNSAQLNSGLFNFRETELCNVHPYSRRSPLGGLAATYSRSQLAQPHPKLGTRFDHASNCSAVVTCVWRSCQS